MYIAADLNTENTKTDYTSGDVFHIGATVAPHLPLGKGVIGVRVNAFDLRQFTGDSGPGAGWGASRK